MIDAGLFVLTDHVIDDSQVDMSKELTGNISDLFMFHMVLNCVIKIAWVAFSELHIVNSHTIICQSFSMHITNSSTDLQELLIARNCLFELA